MSAMTCQEVIEVVTAYLEDSMTAEERSAFEAHLAICDGCEQYLAQMRSTIDLLGQVQEENLRPDTRQRLLDAFADWTNTGRAPGPA